MVYNIFLLIHISFAILSASLVFTEGLKSFVRHSGDLFFMWIGVQLFWEILSSVVYHLVYISAKAIKDSKYGALNSSEEE